MSEQLFRLPEGSTATLRSRVREMLVAAILDGHIPVGAPAPPSRKLAEQLGIGRNTILFVYDQLVEEGYLIARERSGYFVGERIADAQMSLERSEEDDRPGIDYRGRLRSPPSAQRNITKPRSWQSAPFPFVYGQFDPELFPAAEWRDWAF